MARNDHHWAFQPVDPMELVKRLTAALVPDQVDENVTPRDVVSAEMPAFDEQFRERYLLKEVLRKYPSFDLGVDTRLAAMTSFLDDEAVNSQTNDRLLGLPPNGAVATVLQLSRRKIAEILGRFDEREFWRSWRFGPHSTLSLPRLDATADKKMCLGEPSVPARAFGLARDLLSREPHLLYHCTSADATGDMPATRTYQWYTDEDSPGEEVSIRSIDLGNSLKVCEWDRFTSVRKNALTDRGIGIPTDMGVMLQLAVGRMLRKRLHAYGVNLNDQSLNQTAAFLSSCNDPEHFHKATIDVKSASQSVTCGLVWNQIGSQPHRELDPRWYATLDCLRAPFTLIEGRLHENELFSAMGNGYTFELESLLFYALAVSCCDYLAVDADVQVYGDDIVMPTSGGACDLLLEVFEFVGFRINRDKSFGIKPETTSDMHFRESCGKHFLNGVDVTPFYVDTPLDNPSSIVLAYNNLIRWGSKGLYRDSRIYGVAIWLLGHLGDGYRSCCIPFGDEDDGIIVDFDEAAASIRSQRSPHVLPSGRVSSIGRLGYSVKTFHLGGRPRNIPDRERYLRYLYGTKPCSSGWKPPVLGRAFAPGSGYHLAPEPPKSVGEKVSLRAGRRIVYDWPLLGPWVSDQAVEPRSLLTDAQFLWDQRLKRDKVRRVAAPSRGR